jgi:hypothetical protein
MGSNGSGGRKITRAGDLGAGRPALLVAATALRVADQLVFHDPEHPSAVILPAGQPTR